MNSSENTYNNYTHSLTRNSLECVLLRVALHDEVQGQKLRNCNSCFHLLP